MVTRIVLRPLWRAGRRACNGPGGEFTIVVEDEAAVENAKPSEVRTSHVQVSPRSVNALASTSDVAKVSGREMTIEFGPEDFQVYW
jgi:hypothetical protein